MNPPPQETNTNAAMGEEVAFVKAAATELYKNAESRPCPCRERDLFIDNPLVRIHFIIVMIRWTGLAPWEFESPENVPRTP